MRLFKTLTLLLYGTLLATASFAQTEGDDEDTAATDDKSKHKMHMSMSSGDKTPTPTRRWYLGNSFDGAIFSTAVFEKPGRDRTMLGSIRFSLINFGYHFNYDFDEHFGLFTGLGIKNLGFIEKDGDSTIKRRVYTLGIPLGFKLGNLQKRHYGFIGGGIDAPFNYREKGFVNRRDKEKFSEWFSDRTPEFMPYLFAGFAYGSGSTFKVQYYPGNFFNPEFEEEVNGMKSRPYQGYSAHILCVTLGLDLHYNMHNKKKTEETTEAPAEL
jgi:hypothetical protein